MSGSRPTAACFLALAAAGCSVLRPVDPAGGGDPAAGNGAADDTIAAATADSAVGVAAAEDSAYRALLDSARALARGDGDPDEAVEPDTSTAGEEEAGEGEAAEAGEGDGYPGGPVTTTDVERLRELGPVYTPYQRGPRLATREERLDGLLKATLVPVIRRHELPPDAWARYWILVDAEGRVRASRLQLPSGHSSFDEAARAVAETLEFVPARRGGEEVPVWILARISLLMR